jgi:hypothetical protein
MNRVTAAARLHLINPLVMVGIPWLVVAISFAINVAVWGLADLRDEPGTGFTGGVLALYVTVMVVFVQAVTQLLPFAMGISISRRTFYLGTVLVAGVSALGYGVAIAALVEIQGATDGWGVGLNFWAPVGLDVDNFFFQVLASGAPMLAFIASGIGMGVAHKRWGQNGIWGLIVGLVLLLGGLAVLATWLEAWGSIGTWLTDQTPVTLAVGLPVALAVAIGGLSWGGLRRVVP